MKLYHHHAIITITIILFITVYTSLGNLLPKPLAVIAVFLSGELRSIDSITYTTTGPIYRLIIGNYFKGDKKAIWIDAKIVKSAKLNDGITEREAVEMAKQLGLNNIETIQLTYKRVIEDPGRVSPSIPEGVYWYIRGDKTSLFIDFFSGFIISMY